MTKMNLAMLLMALFFFGSSHAQVYQCANAAGKKVFQDRPCANQAQSKAIEIKTHVPSETEAELAKIRSIKQKAHAGLIEADRKAEERKRERARQKCIAAKKEIENHRVWAKHAYTYNGYARSTERAEIAKREAAKVCDSWELEDL